MDRSSIPSLPPPRSDRPLLPFSPADHPYSTRRSVEQQQLQRETLPSISSALGASPARDGIDDRRAPKDVTFELHFDGAPDMRGRLPMRVQIFPHDTTDSIVTTVKNFYGLYDGSAQGVSFEDVRGFTLIPSFDNFANDMVIYVRLVPERSYRPDQPAAWAYSGNNAPPLMAHGGELPPMLPPQPAQVLHYGQPPSRPLSRISRQQSVSPRLNQGRPPSQPKRTRSSIHGPGSSFTGDGDDLNNDAHNGYSSGDGGAGSVTSSRKARSEQLASAEISVDNIVEGGRRKKPKFSSSELPLYVPPQMPAPNSISSISPQRRSNGIETSPFGRPPQQLFTYNVPLQSPPEIPGPPDSQVAASTPGHPFAVPPIPLHTHRLRDRSSGASFSQRSSLGSNNRLRGLNILPTPDPTIASCISDEDVALQLMRLGDASNFSYGRTSASTMDDALSGRAEAASSETSNSDDDSEEDTDDSEPQAHVSAPSAGNANAAPPAKRIRPNGEGLSPTRAGARPSTAGLAGPVGELARYGIKTKAPKARKPRAQSQKVGKQPLQAGLTELGQGFQSPLSPSSVTDSSRQGSLPSGVLPLQFLTPEEEDLSSKPRCQRCRKSKKGCDRQRPCQRCKDAGIGIEGCVSEDDANGRKGRFGRHMGISVKQSLESLQPGDVIDSVSPSVGAASAVNALNKEKKRKKVA